MVTLHLLNTGYCTVFEHQVIEGGRKQEIRCPSLVAVLHHPQAGWLLYDTGYSPRVWQVSAGLPYRIYRKIAPFYAPQEAAIAAQLSHLGLTTGDIKTIIISHFHPDHIGSLKDFPDARFLAMESGHRNICGRRGLAALAAGYLPGLLPVDFTERTTFLQPADFSQTIAILGPVYDLYRDGLLQLVPLPGHAVGQMGLRAQTVNGPVFLVADAAYLRRAVYENRMPALATALFSESRPATRATLKRLHRYTHQYPKTALIPSHCPEVYQEIFGKAL